MDIKEKLIKYWKNAWVDGVCYQFANAMQKLGFEKKDGRKKHQGKVYDAFNEFGGSRATCGAYADKELQERHKR